MSSVPRTAGARIAASTPDRRALPSAWAGIAVVVVWHLEALAIILSGLYLTAHDLFSHPDQIGPVDLLPAAVAVVAALMIRPRGDAFVAPGPRMLRGEQPELFELLDSATTAVGQPPFDEVYVDGSASVSAIPRGGVFGFGSRYALSLGSALLQTLSPEEIRALVASESARLLGGNRFRAFVERARQRMRRRLEAPAGRGAITGLPSRVCSEYFVGATAALSREHALATDDFVAGVIGARPLAAGLSAADLLPAALAAYRRASTPKTFAQFAMSDEGNRAMEFARFRESDGTGAGERELLIRERVSRLAAAAAEGVSFPGQTAARLIGGFDMLDRRVMRDDLVRS